MWAWLRILRNVPTAISDLLGTIAVSTPSAERRTNLTWLPFWLASTNPAASRRRLISRKGWGLSRPNLDLNNADLRQPCCLRRLEVQFNRFLEVGKSLFLSLALARDIEFQALGHIPVTFSPNGSGKRSHHVHIVSQARLLGATAQRPRVPSPNLVSAKFSCGPPFTSPRRGRKSEVLLASSNATYGQRALFSEFGSYSEVRSNSIISEETRAIPRQIEAARFVRLSVVKPLSDVHGTPGQDPAVSAGITSSRCRRRR
jgi:hypothetical protein